MERYNGLNLEERSRITQIQDHLIELYVDRKYASAAGDEARAKEIGRQIDELLEEKAEIEKSVAVS